MIAAGFPAQTLFPFARLPAGFRAEAQPNVVDYNTPAVIYYQVDRAGRAGRHDTSGCLRVKRDPSPTRKIVAGPHRNKAENGLLELMSTGQCGHYVVQASVPARHHQPSTSQSVKDLVVKLAGTGCEAHVDSG